MTPELDFNSETILDWFNKTYDENADLIYKAI